MGLKNKIQCSHINDQLVFKTDVNAINGKRNVFSTTRTENMNIHNGENINIDPYLTPYTKFNLK